ncbi:hypothetical protein ABTK54_19675, partial [Acinetobacter baumannii]
LRLSLLAGIAACVTTPAFAADPAPAPAAPAKDAKGTDQMTSSADQAGQANDKQSLTSSDIIVIGSRAAQAAPVSVSLTTTQPQAAV